MSGSAAASDDGASRAAGARASSRHLISTTQIARRRYPPLSDPPSLAPCRDSRSMRTRMYADVEEQQAGHVVKTESTNADAAVEPGPAPGNRMEKAAEAEIYKLQISKIKYVTTGKIANLLKDAGDRVARP